MDLLHPLPASLLSPMVLAFALGLVATPVRSDLRIPPDVYAALSIYLFFAIGLKGGVKLDGVSLDAVWKPLAAALSLSLAIPLWSFWPLRRACALDAVNAGAIAALRHELRIKNEGPQLLNPPGSRGIIVALPVGIEPTLLGLEDRCFIR